MKPKLIHIAVAILMALGRLMFMAFIKIADNQQLPPSQKRSPVLLAIK